MKIITEQHIKIFPHGSLLEKKAASSGALKAPLLAYRKFCDSAKSLEVVDVESIGSLVSAFNEYRRESIYIFEGGKNVPQENLRSTMMEEFLIWLFKDIFLLLDRDVPNNFRIGKTLGSYISLNFAPFSFADIFKNPNPRVGTKDQDFALGAQFKLAIKSVDNGDTQIVQDILIPMIAIECKTYLAKNHLDMCSATAASIRVAAPYCMYMVLAEFLKMDKAVAPELTDISEIYVLCKAPNADRKRRRDAGLPPHDIDLELIVDLFKRVVGHLRSIWWDPATALERGKVISRPF